MTAPARFTKADVKRALSGASAAGFIPAKFLINSRGEIEVLLANGKKPHDNDEWADLE